MIKVNLLPVRAARKKETFMNQIYVGILVIIISLGIVGWRTWSNGQKIESLESQIADRKRELNELRDIQKQVEEYKAKNKILQDKISVMTSLEEGRDWYIQIIDHIGMSIPEIVWIQSLSMGATRGRGGGAGIYSAPVKINGGAYEKDAIGYFISNLESNKKYVSSVNLGKIDSKRMRGTGQEYYNYDLTINIKQPPKTVR